jgi:hypothetical protein
MLNYYRNAVSLLTLIFMLWGCVSWQPAWEQAPEPGKKVDTTLLLKKAQSLALKAEDLATLQNTMSAYHTVLEFEPANYHALSALGNLNILLGAAYTDDRSEKIDLYLKAMRFSEQAMYTNAEFKKSVDLGQKPWEASQVLTQREVDVMFYWVTAVLYYFKEGMSLPEKVANVKWIRWCGDFLLRIESIDPTWGGGGVQFSLALYYGILPQSMGGDSKKSEAYLGQSIEIGPDWLLNRWGRAKYFSVRDKNRSRFEADLRWVVDQDIHKAGGDYAWKVYFQRDAEKMLSDIDRYF